MKICFIVVECSLNNISNGCGGVGTFYASLAKQLAVAGHQVEVLVFPVYNLVYEPILENSSANRNNSDVLQNCDEYIFNEDSIVIRYLFHSSYNRTYLEFSNEYYLFIRDYVKQYCLLNNPDVVEVSEGGGYIKYASATCPIVMRLHSGYTLLSGFNNYDAHWIKPIIESENLGFAIVDSIAGVSNYVIEQTKSSCNILDKKIYGAIYNGIEMKQFLYADYSSVKAKTLICVGGLYEGKGIARLLKLFNEVYDLDNEIKLILIGKGDLDSFVNNLSPRARSNVYHYAHVKHSEVVSRLKESCLFITASMHEACPLSPMEAMAVGRAVFVYSECKSFSEIVTNNVNGIIWNNIDDTLGAAKSIVNLLNNQQKMQAMGLNGLYDIKNKFDINRLVSDSEAWYKCIINNHLENKGKNHYRQFTYMRDIIVNGITHQNINNAVLIDLTLPFHLQLKTFLKQVLMSRGINKKNLFSFNTIRKILSYVKNKL